MMPRNVYWKMIFWEYNHDYIIYIWNTINDGITGFVPPFNSDDWDKITDIIHNSSGTDIELNISNALAAYS